MADDTQAVEDNQPDVSTDDAYEDMSLVDTPMDATAETPATDSVAEVKAEGDEETSDDKPTEGDEKSEGEQPPATEQTAETDAEAATRRYNDQMAQQRIAERQRTRMAVERQVDEVYGPKTEEQLYDEAIEQGRPEEVARYEAQVQALREEMQFDKQRTYIAELNAGMQAEAVNVEHDFGVFNPKSPEYDADFTRMVEQQYQTAARLQTDENGLILNAEVPLYEFHKQMADIYNRGQSKGADRGQEQALEALSRTESPGSSSPTHKGPETLEEMEQRLGNMPIV